MTPSTRRRVQTVAVAFTDSEDGWCLKWEVAGFAAAIAAGIAVSGLVNGGG